MSATITEHPCGCRTIATGDDEREERCASHRWGGAYDAARKAGKVPRDAAEEADKAVPRTGGTLARAREDIVAAACARIREGSTIVSAFALEGVPKRTAYNWMQGDESIRDAVDLARGVASETRRLRFEADPSSAYLHYMQGLDPDSFPVAKQVQEVTGKDGGPQQVEHAITITRDEAISIARKKGNEDR